MLVLPAYAKLNLALEVVGRRPDGYHDLETVVVIIDWHDLVGVAADDSATGGIRLGLSGPMVTGVPRDGSNLAVRAAAAAAEELRWPASGSRIELWLDKHVPAAAGLGGGSADAAAVLACTARLVGRGAAPSRQRLLEVAANLGSDIPAVLAGGAQFVTGRGESLRPLPTPSLHVVVAVAGTSSTRRSFLSFSVEETATGGRGTGRARRIADALEKGGPLPADDLGSALEAAARRAHPQLGTGLDALRRAEPGRSWHMTGSGGAAFTIVAGAAEAGDVAARVVAAGLPARACRTVGGVHRALA